MKPLALVLKAPGTNCDGETELCCSKAGFDARITLLNEAVESPGIIGDASFIVFPGGFSFGDDISAGKVFAIYIKQNLLQQLLQFHKKGGLMLGACNGFQVMAKSGLLPVPDGVQRITLAANQSGRFECRWIRLKVTNTNCVFLRGLTSFDLPVAHGEGRVAGEQREIDSLAKHAALRYTDEFGSDNVAYPLNPNGSPEGIAGLCDSTGRILGLMPHPERFHSSENHPHHTRTPQKLIAGLKFFHNAYDYIKDKM